MAYFVYPQSSASHTVTFEARDSDVATSPYIATGLDIEWQIGSTVVKTGNTSNEADRKINTGDVEDYNFTAEDTGFELTFVINGTTTSTGTILTNNLPTIDSAAVEIDGSGQSPRSPKFSWTFSDSDGDRQLIFRLKVGTTTAGNDIYDSGEVYGDPGDTNGDKKVNQSDLTLVHSLYGKTSSDSEYVLAVDMNRDGIIDDSEIDIVERFIGSEYSSDGSESYTIQLPEMAPNTIFFWTLTVSDGENTEPGVPDRPAVFVKASGQGITTSRPVVTNVLIGGV